MRSNYSCCCSLSDLQLRSCESFIKLLQIISNHVKYSPPLPLLRCSPAEGTAQKEAQSCSPCSGTPPCCGLGAAPLCFVCILVEFSFLLKCSAPGSFWLPRMCPREPPEPCFRELLGCTQSSLPLPGQAAEGMEVLGGLGVIPLLLTHGTEVRVNPNPC